MMKQTKCFTPPRQLNLPQPLRTVLHPAAPQHLQSSLCDCFSGRAVDSLVRGPADSLGPEVTAAAAAAAPQSYVDAIRTGLNTTAKEQCEIE